MGFSPPSESFTPLHPPPLMQGVKRCVCSKSKILGFRSITELIRYAPWVQMGANRCMA